MTVSRGIWQILLGDASSADHGPLAKMARVDGVAVPMVLHVTDDV